MAAPSLSDATSISEQIGNVLEAWSDPEDPGLHFVVLDSGHPTSKMEAHIASDPEVVLSVRRTISCSPQGSLARAALALVAAACTRIGGKGNAPDLDV